MLHLIFSSLWVLPLYIICKLINIVWFSDISNSIYRALYGKTRPFPSLSVAFADLIYSLTFEIVFFIQAQFVNVVPMMNAEIEHLQIQVMCYIAYTFYCIHVCLLYAIYAFEYKWFNMGIELRNRIELIERHWPYFCGFGLPMFLLTNVAFTYYPLVASACVYSSVFPFFIVSGTRASTPRSEAPFTLYLTKPSISFCNLLFNNAFRRQQANWKIKPFTLVMLFQKPAATYLCRFSKWVCVPLAWVYVLSLFSIFQNFFATFVSINCSHFDCLLVFIILLNYILWCLTANDFFLTRFYQLLWLL